MSNVITFPNAEARDHLKIDRALDRFHASAVDDMHERDFVIDTMMWIGRTAATEAGRIRACQWLSEIWDIASLDEEATPLEPGQLG